MKNVIQFLLLIICSATLAAQDEPGKERPVRTVPTRKISPAEPPPPVYAPSAKAYISAAVNDVDRLFRARETAPPVIIHFKKIDDTQVAEMEEDLTVMSHLLDKSLGKAYPNDGPAVRMGIPMIFSAGRSVRAQYIEGFGALFLMKADFPLTGEEAVDTNNEKEKTSSDWERARKEVFGIRENKQEELLEFNADTVATLKSELLQALKEAKNIRHLKEDDVVALTVFGAPPKSAAAKEGPRKGTVLTMRITQKQITSAASEKADDETFEKAVSSHAYRGNTGESGSTFLHRLRNY